MRPFIPFAFFERTLGVMAYVALVRRWGFVMQSLFLALLTTSLFVLGAYMLFFGVPKDIVILFSSDSQVASPAATIISPFVYDFRVPGVLVETKDPEESSSPYWWLNSGARLILENGVGKTIQGALPRFDRTRLHYSFTNSDETEDGYAPQNLFRLLSRASWENVRFETSFRIIRDNFTETPQRNASNGLLLTTRYQDADTLYYAGIRVDGHAVVKKKSGGTYYTMAEKNIFASATTTYAREKDMNLLPHNEWISLRSETKTMEDGAVRISLFMKRAHETKWTPLLSVSDDGTQYASTTPITGAHPLGIRTDFMDVEFDNIRVEKI